MKKKGKIIVIVAPSGSGKSTLIKKLRVDFPSIKESVSYTTRPKREGEEEGKSYFFISPDRFQELLARDFFLEHAEVHGNYYGTSRDYVQNSLEQGDILLFDLDVQGADNFKDFFGDLAHIIFIAPPSLEELKSRLVKRNTETPEALSRRLQNAKNEILKKDDYDFLVINQDLDLCYSNLKDIFNSILKN